MSADPHIEVLRFYGTNGQPIELAGLTRPTRRRSRRPNLASALKQAGKAGVAVSGATIRPDGSVALEFGNPDSARPESNEWDSVQ